MRRKRGGGLIAAIICILLAAVIAVGAAVFLFMNQEEPESPEELLTRYMSYIGGGNYGQMYAMLDGQSKINISEEDFTTRNKNIYEGIEAQNVSIEMLDRDDLEEGITVYYNTRMDSVAGEISFQNHVLFTEDKELGYQLSWSDSAIFPEFSSTDKVRVNTSAAERGSILDRNAALLAGPGTASSVGLVPGKMQEDRAEDVEKLAELLGVTAESIEKKLSAQWVRDDYLVPIKTIKKIRDTDLMQENPTAETLADKERQDKLLTIPGVMISDTEVRTYPLGNKASHLTGYVQNVTAEDLEKHKGEGYRSVIGRSGMESLYEKELKGQNGCEVVIVDSDNSVKRVLASIETINGEDIQLTIDSELQKMLYDQFGEDESCSAAMNPYTGEVLALVSTPSFDSNDFIIGMSTEQWNSLNDNEAQPLFNRFRQRFSPGSSFKPVTAAIGLGTGAIDPDEDFGYEGLSWQKDSSWGNYRVTTLHDYRPVILENALIYSDNIYFAKAALKIGTEGMMTALDGLGFNQELPFEISMAKSQYSNDEEIENEVLLADSGYGQGQVLVNPLHLAAIYTAFANDGNMIQPYLRCSAKAASKIWIPQAFAAEDADRVKTGLVKVINDPAGTGYAARMEQTVLAGKTGTAEIKASQSDTAGTELGCFSVFTADPSAKRPILLVSMVEDVKGRGGSGYVVSKAKTVLDAYFSGTGGWE